MQDTGTRLSVLALALMLALPTATGCSPAPEAPTDLSDISRYVMREYDNEDPRVLEGALVNLEAVFDGVDLEGDLRDERTFTPDNLTEEDLAGIETPEGMDPMNLVPVGVVGLSRQPVANHQAFQRQPNQLPAEPSAERYIRTYLAPDDPECFGTDEGCLLLRTENDIRRVNALMRIDFILLKDFRLVDLDGDGPHEGRRAMVGRSWIATNYFGDNGANELRQSYTQDFFIDREDGTTLRYQVLQSETLINGSAIEPGIQQAVVRGSIDDSFGAADDAIDELLDN